MLILALHIRDTRNAGDRWSCPLDYLDLGAEVIFGDMRQPPDCRPDLVVYGGGSITASPDFKRWSCPVVAWGVGHNERANPSHEAMQREHDRAAALCDLYFSRDRVDGHEWVPCASCLHPVFDEAIEPTHEVVRYSAARRITVEGGGPHMTNEDGSIEDAVRFIGSGATVVTSSYHGAYWARLLGREVRMVEWGTKFRYVPDIGLQACRAANTEAHRKVGDLIGAFHA
jgi:hypothetical protein